MVWLRSKVRSVSWVALFALTLQLLLSPGHIHRSDMSRIAADTPSTSEQEPLKPSKHSGIVDKSCAICAFLKLAESLLSPERPALPLQATFGRARLEARIPAATAISSHHVFQARAPPIV
jgi:hypothetical protein